MTEKTDTPVPVPAIDPSQDPLWQRIDAFEFEAPGTALTFARRLARENGWSAAYAERVIAEYKRFCYLALTAGHPVTPSDAVDQAWHLHLSYSENYWDGFCGNVLEQPLHHGPTRGGDEEQVKYRDWYRATLEAYARVSGEPPPPDIWPDVGRRFHGADAMRRVNAADNWIVPKPSQGTLWMGQLGAAIGAVVFFSISQSTLGFLCVIAFIAIFLYRGRLKRSERRHGRDGDPGGFWLGCAGGDWGGGDGGGGGCGGGG